VGSFNFDLVGRPEHDIGSAAVGLPAGHCLRKVDVCVCNASIMLDLEFVYKSARHWIAALPELFYELVAVFVLRQTKEGGSLFIGDNPAYILIQPPLVADGWRWVRDTGPSSCCSIGPIRLSICGQANTQSHYCLQKTSGDLAGSTHHESCLV